MKSSIFSLNISTKIVLNQSSVLFWFQTQRVQFKQLQSELFFVAQHFLHKDIKETLLVPTPFIYTSWFEQLGEKLDLLWIHGIVSLGNKCQCEAPQAYMYTDTVL